MLWALNRTVSETVLLSTQTHVSFDVLRKQSNFYAQKFAEQDLWIISRFWISDMNPSDNLRFHVKRLTGDSFPGDSFSRKNLNIKSILGTGGKYWLIS